MSSVMGTPPPIAGTARAARLEAPVPFDALRPRLQAMRAASALLLLAAAAAGFVFDMPWALPRAIAFGVVLVDALANLRRAVPAVWPLAVDAAAFGLVAGLGGDAGAPAIALLAYLLVGGALLVPRRHVAWLFATATAAVVGRTWFLAPITAGSHEEVSVAYGLLEAAVLIVGATVLVLTGAAMVRSAQQRHAVALRAEQRASEMKNEFVSMISHELRTPLTTISGFGMSLQESWQHLDPAEVEEFLGIICSEAEHLSDLVDDILAIPRLEAGRLQLEPTDFSLQPAAFRIAEMLFPEGGETSATVAIPGNVVVRADPNRVEQVLRNLLDNARKHGGSHVGIEAIRRGGHYLVVVADNGPGVPADRRERIFDRFEQGIDTTNPTGTGIGLGLTVTRHLVDAMGGEVWYEPGFPVGARFCFTLPVGSHDAEARPGAAPRRAAATV